MRDSLCFQTRPLKALFLVYLFFVCKYQWYVATVSSWYKEYPTGSISRVPCFFLVLSIYEVVIIVCVQVTVVIISYILIKHHSDFTFPTANLCKIMRRESEIME